jgi:DNA-binding CsgD family transcriptional regulator
MWEDRADRIRRDVAALAAEGLGAPELHAAAIRLVADQVSTDLTCWATIDPETLVISTMVSGDVRIPAEFEPRLAEAEYSADEPHTFADLARRTVLTARLSDLSASDRSRSARLNTVWRPLGLDRELRVLFLADRTCWGGAGLVRAGRDFTDREIDFLTAVAPAIAGATRLAVRGEVHGSSVGARPAIVIVGTRGELRGITEGARGWQERLDEIAPGRFLVMMQVMAAGARSTPAGEFRARVRDAGGQWAVLQASSLIGGNGDEIAVTIEPATGDQLTSLLLIAYGLTRREREICREVITGGSTVEIAERLFISPHTVQDHLKSVFAKVGVGSRGELAGRLRPDSPLLDRGEARPVRS